MKPIKTLIIFFLIFWSAVEAQPLKCSVRAPCAILYNPDNGAILFEKNSDEPRYPASIIKIATGLYVLEKLKLDLKTKCTVSHRAIEKIHAEEKHANPLFYPAYILEHDGKSLGLVEGKSYTLETLLYGTLLYSANDPANVIAECCCGLVETFVEEVNHYLKEKGISHTRMQNPHGLYHPAQMTTACDMAHIAALAFKNPVFSRIICSKSYEDDQLLGPIINMNRLIKEGKYHYSKALGGKTGYTASSGHNLVAAAQDKERKLIAVVLGCSSSEEMYEDAITLFETAFREKPQSRLLFTKKDQQFTRSVDGAKDLHGILEDTIEISFYPSEERPIKTELVWDPVNLPIAAGAKVGQLKIHDGAGRIYTSTHIYASHSLTKSIKWRKLWLICSSLIFVLGAIQLFKKRSKVLKR